MRRKKKVNRNIQPDRKYGSVLISQFINNIMKNGKKSKAEKIIYDALDLIKKETKQDPIVIFEKAIKNIAPNLEVKSRRIGGASYQVPREVRGDRKITLAFRWILKVTRAQKGSSMYKKLAQEIILASKNEGASIKKRSDTHRMAEANRAFAHFSW